MKAGTQTWYTFMANKEQGPKNYQMKKKMQEGMKTEKQFNRLRQEMDT
mgnify:CR=1 FL=1